MRIVGLLVLVACGWGSHARLRDWQSDVTLFAAAVRVDPQSPRAAINYADALADAGRWEEATAMVLQGARLALPRPERGRLYRDLDRIADQIEVFGQRPVCDSQDFRDLRLCAHWWA